MPYVCMHVSCVSMHVICVHVCVCMCACDMCACVHVCMCAVCVHVCVPCAQCVHVLAIMIYFRTSAIIIMHHYQTHHCTKDTELA